jgi:thioesterase domain-containing protein
MAQQLYEQGEKVNLLAILDIQIPEAFPVKEGESSFLSFLRAMSQEISFDAISIYCKVRGIDNNIYRLKEILENDIASLTEEQRLKCLAIGLGKFSTNLIKNLYTIITLSAFAIRNYKPEPYNEKLIFLKASERTKRDVIAFNNDVWGNEKDKVMLFDIIEQKDGGWGKYCNDIDTYEVPGNHFTMIDRLNAKYVADIIKEYINSNN